MKSRTLRIIGARENNLKDLSLDIPHDAFVAVTGVSGSGKTSLAFDTVYAEGQRRYIETFSPYTRQFFDKVKKPDVDLVQQVRPAIAIQQRTRVTNSRSTVGSMTGINDYLKILWSNLAAPFCADCGIAFECWETADLAAHVAKLHMLKGFPTLLICAAIKILAGKKALLLEKERLEILGYSRFYDLSRAAIVPSDELTQQSLMADGRLLLVLDRLRGSANELKQLRDSIEQAFVLSSGSCVVINADLCGTGGLRHFRTIINEPRQANVTTHPALSEFHSHFSCAARNVTVEKARPALFSFNHPIGACPDCNGFGRILSIDPAKCVPNPGLSIKEKALQCWSSEASGREFRRLLAFCAAQKISTNAPWRELPEAQKDLIFNHKSREYRGVLPWFKRIERKIYKMHVRVFLSRYRTQVVCRTCGGARLKPDALAYRIKGAALPDVWNMPAAGLRGWLEDILSELKTCNRLSRDLNELFSAMLSRLDYLIKLGLPYLTLERQARTLSGGETQRVNLAAALGSELVCTHFVLDEPSVGLHARDTERLAQAVRSLQQRGNSVLVVEHDADFISKADYVIELGPQAGEEGGELVYQGALGKWREAAQFENGSAAVKTQKPKGAPRNDDGVLKISNARARNLKGFSLDIPLGKFVCLTGVSGSGKSTLVTEVVKRAYEEYCVGTKPASEENTVSGFEQLTQVLLVDQSPLAKSPRANIATFTGIWDRLREAFAASDGAIIRALSKSSFSFNVDGGRCPACKGAGYIREDMQFLSDVFIPCELCLGRRFQEEVLAVSYRGKNVSDYLNMSILRCRDHIAEDERIAQSSSILCDLGLGHLTLGHPLSELSGGEAQRLKLVPFLQRAAHGSALLIFDEPTIGLHSKDVSRLIQLFHRLKEAGHSLLCVEHNLQLICAADWIVDLGPEGGDAGGHVMMQGTPAGFAAAKDSSSATAHFMQRNLALSAAASVNHTTLKIRDPADKLSIKGAREHNLKNIDVEIPLDRMVAVTGVSGSGKSSIAKDIIYAEGQRRYLDCLSPYARQFIKELKKPDIESIRNVKPTICVYQHTFQPTHLSTVATLSEVYNFLRLLYAKTAMQYCPEHPEQAIVPASAALIAASIKRIKGAGVRILAPVVKLKKGQHRAVFERAAACEITEVRVDGVFDRPSSYLGGLEKGKAHSIDYTLAKFTPRQVDKELIEEAVTQALSLGAGVAIVNTGGKDSVYSIERACPICRRGFFKPDPEDLSFSSRRGRCSACDGAGFNAEGERCSECSGARISALGRNLRLGSEALNIYEACAQNAPQLKEFLRNLPFIEREKQIAAPILGELFSRLELLSSIRLDYLTLGQSCATLSSGELQRLRLATAMGSHLCGVMYIFDEPSAGLHPLDNELMLSRMQDLKERGNSVLIIEHDKDTILACDHIVDVGPGGGSEGGRIVFNGALDDFIRQSSSPTAQALRDGHERSAVRALFNHGAALSIRSGRCNNIKELSLDLPLFQLTAVIGVSGSGKSSLLHGIVSETMRAAEKGSREWRSNAGIISSGADISRVLLVDQKPIGTNARSTPASYLGVFDHLRALFAASLEAKARGWKAGYFSYNTGKGRCPECKGQGQIKLEMSFLPEAHVLCESCQGRRYTAQAESVRYLNLSISEVLALTFDEARTVFANHRRIHEVLHNACELGLGYLTLGQSSATLSGGESQRIKLVAEMTIRAEQHTLYLLDEPTTGLHRADVKRLVNFLRRLVERGNTVIVIEHDSEVINGADFLVELGPGPAERGGKVIFSGSPEKLRGADTPWGKIMRDKERDVVQQSAAKATAPLSAKA